MTRAPFALALLLAACVHPPPATPPVISPQSHDPTPVISPAPVASVAPGAFFCLRLTTDAPDGSFLRAIFAASEDWNRALSPTLGREVFGWHEGKVIRLAQYASIVGPAEAGGMIGGVTFRASGVVVFSGAVPEGYRYTVAAHELGHVIGIPHSNDPADLMFPKGREGATITPNDTRRALELLAREDAQP